MTIKSPETCGIAVVCSDLLADGWREYQNQFRKYARCFYKRFDTPTRCHGNNDKAGVQIQISVSYHEWRASMELELCASLKDKTWLTIQNYSLPNTVKEVTALIPRMLLVWESANVELSDDAHQDIRLQRERNGVIRSNAWLEANIQI